MQCRIYWGYWTSMMRWVTAGSATIAAHKDFAIIGTSTSIIVTQLLFIREEEVVSSQRQLTTNSIELMFLTIISEFVFTMHMYFATFEMYFIYMEFINISLWEWWVGNVTVGRQCALIRKEVTEGKYAVRFFFIEIINGLL